MIKSVLNEILNNVEVEVSLKIESDIFRVFTKCIVKKFVTLQKN